MNNSSSMVNDKILELNRNINNITIDIEDDKKKLEELEKKKTTLESEEPKKLFLFGGKRSEDDIRKDKENNLHEIKEMKRNITEKEKRLVELKNDLSYIKNIETLYNTQLENLSNNNKNLLKSSLEKQEQESKKQKEEILKSFQDETSKLKNIIEEQKKIIAEKITKEKADDKQKEAKDNKLEEKTKVLSDKEITDLAKETINYFNSVPKLVDRNGGNYTKKDVGDIKNFLIEHDLKSIQDVKDGVNQALRKALSFYDNEEEKEDYEEKDTDELIEDLDAKNNDLIERIQKNDKEAVEKCQNIINNIQKEKNSLGVFMKILMWFGYDYNNLNTKMLMAKDQLEREKNNMIRNEKRIIREKESYNRDMKNVISQRLKQDREEINSDLYDSYSELEFNNVGPNVSLKSNQREEGFSLLH